jgi:ATP-binding cassette subfamily B protein
LGRRESNEYPVGGLASVRRALGYLRSYKAEASGAFVALILSSAASLATPQLIRVGHRRGHRAARLRVILLAVGGLVGAALLRGLFQFLQGYLAEGASQGVAYDLRNVLFEKIERWGSATTTG